MDKVFIGERTSLTEDLLGLIVGESSTTNPVWGGSSIQVVQLPNVPYQNLIIPLLNSSNAERYPVAVFKYSSDGLQFQEIAGYLNWASYSQDYIQYDFNGDGAPDIFIGGAAGHNPEDQGMGEVPLLALSSGGSWRTSATALQSSYAHGWVGGDFNGDGTSDIVILNQVYNDKLPLPNLLLNDGKGNFTSARNQLPPEIVGTKAYSTDGFHFFEAGFLAGQAADLDGDGDLDVVVPETTGLSYAKDSNLFSVDPSNPFKIVRIAGQVWINDGKGTFTVSPARLPDALTTDPAKPTFSTSVAINDIDSDGDPDVVYTANPMSPSGDYSDGFAMENLRILTNDGYGKFTDVTTSRISSESLWVDKAWGRSTKFADVNGDGYSDIVVEVVGGAEGASNARSCAIYINNGFGYYKGYMTQVPTDWAHGYTFSDLNKDGVIDILFDDHGSTWNGYAFRGGVYVAYGSVIHSIQSQTGSSGNDLLIGFGDGAKLTGLAGDDEIHGGVGLDIAVYRQAFNNYSIHSSGDIISIIDHTGFDGSDNLTQVERLQFLDKSVALDTGPNGNAGKVVEIIGAVFGASTVSQHPDYIGIGLQLMDGGVSEEELAALALGVTGKTAAFDIVNLLWTNVVGSLPAADQAQPFVNLLNQGMSTGALVMLAAETSINQSNVNLVGLATTGVEYI